MPPTPQPMEEDNARSEKPLARGAQQSYTRLTGTLHGYVYPLLSSLLAGVIKSHRSLLFAFLLAFGEISSRGTRGFLSASGHAQWHARTCALKLALLVLVFTRVLGFVFNFVLVVIASVHIAEGAIDSTGPTPD